MAGFSNDTGTSQVCRTECLPVRVRSFTLFITVMMKVFKVPSLLPTNMYPHILLYLYFMKRSIFVFKIILTVIKHKKDFQMHVHSEAFKKTLPWEGEPQPSFHYYYNYYKILALFHVRGILKNHYDKQKEERHLRCIRGAIVWTLWLSITFLLKRK